MRMLLVLLLISVALESCGSSPAPSVPAEKRREFANVLYNQQLYRQAIAEYEIYLRDYPLEAKERANIFYQVANIYFDRLKDYENALAYYLRAKYMNTQSTIQAQISKQVVACLERLERSGDARQEMAKTAALDESQKPKSRPGEVIASIGERKITSGDLAFQISRLPEYVQTQIKETDKKKEFLQQYIAQELLYDSAKRKGLATDKQVVEGVFQAKKALMAEKLLQEEIEQEAGIDKYTNEDVELYYKANRSKYVEKKRKGKVKRQKKFSEVAQQVAQDFIREKKQKAYQRIIERLMKAERVVIHEDKIN